MVSTLPGEYYTAKYKKLFWQQKANERPNQAKISVTSILFHVDIGWVSLFICCSRSNILSNFDPVNGIMFLSHNARYCYRTHKLILKNFFYLFIYLFFFFYNGDWGVWMRLIDGTKHQFGGWTQYSPFLNIGWPCQIHERV